MSEECDEWGPWIEHDGNGCPLEVMGQVVELYWRPDMDRDDTAWRHAVLRVDDLFGSCSSWHASKYEGTGCFQHWDGKRLDLPGGPHWVDRYRIRKPRALRDLIERVESLPAPERIPEGVAEQSDCGLARGLR